MRDAGRGALTGQGADELTGLTANTFCGVPVRMARQGVAMDGMTLTAYLYWVVLIVPPLVMAHVIGTAIWRGLEWITRGRKR